MASIDVNNSSIFSENSWIEQPAIGIFRIWHIIFLSFSSILCLVILLCCCIKIRIPRTKQEIEADYQRKKIARKFRQHLKMINNQDIDTMDLKRALEKIQEDIKSEAGSESDAGISILANTFTADVVPSPLLCHSKMKAEPQQPLDISLPQKIEMLVKINKMKQLPTKIENDK